MDMEVTIQELETKASPVPYYATMIMMIMIQFLVFPTLSASEIKSASPVNYSSFEKMPNNSHRETWGTSVDLYLKSYFQTQYIHGLSIS
jgi:hypothetical protein